METTLVKADDKSRVSIRGTHKDVKCLVMAVENQRLERRDGQFESQVGLAVREKIA